MAKYLRSLLDILDEVVSGMSFPVTVGSVVTDGDLQTLFCCDIYHAQKGFKVAINGLEYTITDFSQENESITVSGEGEILPGVTFFLYGPIFFHGTPITTDEELKQIVPAEAKTPMIWLWENFKEKTFIDEIIERKTEGLELYCLTQPPIDLGQMINDDIHNECVKPMRRLGESLKAEIIARSDLFETDGIDFDFENFAKFGVMARSKGSTKTLMADNLSGVAMYTDLQLYWKDHCECPPPQFGIGSMIVGQNFIVS
jgi:hypothetical protein